MDATGQEPMGEPHLLEEVDKALRSADIQGLHDMFSMVVSSEQEMGASTAQPSACAALDIISKLGNTIVERLDSAQMHHAMPDLLAMMKDQLPTLQWFNITLRWNGDDHLALRLMPFLVSLGQGYIQACTLVMTDLVGRGGAYMVSSQVSASASEAVKDLEARFSRSMIGLMQEMATWQSGVSQTADELVQRSEDSVDCHVVVAQTSKEDMQGVVQSLAISSTQVRRHQCLAESAPQALAQGLLDSICKWPERLRAREGHTGPHRALLENCLKEMQDGELRCNRIEPSELVDRCDVAQGGFADVMRATWRDQVVAVKRFRPFSSAQGRALVHSFVKEVCLLSQLSHPNIVHLHGITAELDNGWLGLVLEWAGESLAMVMADERAGGQAASPDMRLQWAIGTAEGLQYLHSQRPRIVHRDLTGLNVLVNQAGHARLIDFGISQSLQQTYLTMNYACNHAWMAPEVLSGHENVKGLQVHSACDEKCDVYSFGVILGALATGHEPWEGMTGWELQRDIAQGAQLGTPEVPQQWLQQLIQQCMSEAPASRPTMQQVLKVLHDNSADGIICSQGPWPVRRS